MVFLAFAYSNIRSSQEQVGVPLAHKFKQDPRSSPYQHKCLPQAKQSRQVQNSLWPWFSGLNKDSRKDRSYGSVAWSPSNSGIRVKRSSTWGTEQDAKNEDNRLCPNKLVWSEEFQLQEEEEKTRQGLSSSQTIIGSAQIS